MTDQCHLPLAFFIWKSDLICINSYFSCSRKESLGHVCRRLRYSQIRYNAYCQFYCQFYINAPFVFCCCFISISEYCDLFALYMYFCLCLKEYIYHEQSVAHPTPSIQHVAPAARGMDSFPEQYPDQSQPVGMVQFFCEPLLVIFDHVI